MKKKKKPKIQCALCIHGTTVKTTTKMNERKTKCKARKIVVAQNVCLNKYTFAAQHMTFFIDTIFEIKSKGGTPKARAHTHTPKKSENNNF